MKTKIEVSIKIDTDPYDLSKSQRISLICDNFEDYEKSLDFIESVEDYLARQSNIAVMD